MKQGTKIALGAAALLIAAPIALSSIGTFNSVATAPGRVVSKTMQTDNIIDSYEAFFAKKAQYDARVSQISTHKTLLSEDVDPAEASRLRIELAAMRASCRDLANGYNADVGKVNKGLFRDSKLPEALEVSACEA